MIDLADGGNAHSEYEPYNRLDPRVEILGNDDFTTEQWYPFRQYPHLRKNKDRDQRIIRHHSGARINSVSDSGSAAIGVQTSDIFNNNHESPIEVDATSGAGNISIYFPDSTPKTTVNANSDSGAISVVFANDIKTSANINTSSDPGNVSIVLAKRTDQTVVSIAAVTDSGAVNISDQAFLGHFSIVTQTGGFYVGVEDTEHKVVDVKGKIGGIVGGMKEGDVRLRRGNEGRDAKLGHVNVVTDSGDIIMNF
jgi:hypothetical protein